MRAAQLRCKVHRPGNLLGVVLAFAVHDSAAAKVSAAGEPNASAEIIITARRHEEPLARAAAPVSAISGDEIIEAGISRADLLDEQFPSLAVQPTASGNLIFVRGVGNFTLLPNSDPAVGFAYDGVFIGRPMGTISQFFDLDRIELLKGPQGVLYGRNASAGSINLQPRQPVVGETSASSDLSYLAGTEVRGEGAINVPFRTGGAMRLAGAVSEQDALLKGYRTGPTQGSARAQLKSFLGERISVRLSADYNRIGGVGIGTSYVGNYVFDNAARLYRFVQSGLPLSEGIYSPEAQSFRQTIFLNLAGRTLDSIASRPWQSSRFFGVHAHFDADLDFGNLTVIPAWRRASVNAIVSGSPFGYRQIEQNDQASVEARLSGRSGSVDWLAGSFLFNDKTNSDTMTNLSSVLVESGQSYETFSGALFVNSTLHASARFRLNGGLRWTVDQKDFRSDSVTLSIICLHRVNNRPSCPTVPLFPLVDDLADVPFPIPNAPGPRLPILIDGVPTGAVVDRSELRTDGRLTDRAVTWRLGSEYDVGSRSLLYLTAETAYRPGGFNTATGFETYEPERMTAFTLGGRHRSADGRIGIDFEAFWWNYRDQQVSSLRPDLSASPRNANITENIGNSRIRGIEADVRGRPWPQAEVRAIVQYLDADYRSFEYVYANNGVPPLTGCATKLDQAANLYTVDCRGKQPYNSPRWSVNFSARQGFDVRSFTLTAVADTQVRSARNIGFAFLPEQRIGRTWTSNAQLILSSPSRPFEVAIFVRNIQGDRIPQFMIYHPLSNALVAGTSAPRQFGVRASIDL